MKLTRAEQHEVIISVLKGNIEALGELYAEKVEAAIEARGVYANGHEDTRAFLDASIKQDIDEDDVGGFIEEYFSVGITVTYENDSFSVSTDVDTSHVFERLDNNIGDFIMARIPGLTRTNYSGLSAERTGLSMEQAVTLAIRLYNLLHDVSITKDGTITDTTGKKIPPLNK